MMKKAPRSLVMVDRIPKDDRLLPDFLHRKGLDCECVREAFLLAHIRQISIRETNT
jgi:hypothetical protein